MINLIGWKNITETHHPTYAVFNRGNISQQEAKDNLNIHSEKVLLFFGFVREYKGLEYLLKSMPRVLEQVNVHLLVAGEFWDDKQKYLDLMDILLVKNHVTIHDEYIPNERIPFYFRASDMVILPYTSVTGSGLVQLAFGFNKPVVVSDIGALSQIVMDKKTGFLVSPENPQAIAESIIDFYQNYDEQEMAENIKNENYRFSWEFLIGKIENFIK